MQKNTWIWVVIVVIVVAAAGFFFYKNGGSMGLSTLGNTSLRSLLSANSPQTCSFNNGQSSGTIYVSAGRMRGDFAAKTGDASAQSHMIITNNIAYVWIDGLNQGYRMPFEDLSASSTNKQNGGVDADAKVATKCQPWSATDASFALPTDITFNAVGAPVGDMAPTSSNTGSKATTSGASTGASGTAETGSYYAQQCAACNAIADAAGKAQCIASFDCPAQ